MHLTWIYSTDSFAHLVCRELSSWLQKRNVQLVGDDAQLLEVLDRVEKDDIFILVSAIPKESVSRAIDACCSRVSASFITAVLEDGALRVGPIIHVPFSACYSCWRSREAASHPLGAERDKLFAYYDQNPHSCVHWYTPYIASIAAAKLSIMVDLENESRVAAGKFWTINLSTRAIHESRAIGRHACPNCDNSYFGRTINDLQGLL